MGDTNKIPVTITYARNSVPFPADVAPQCPAQMIIEGLLSPTAGPDGPFLPPTTKDRPYVLVLERTSKSLAPAETMTAAGVRPHDVLIVEQMAQGASSCPG